MCNPAFLTTLTQIGTGLAGSLGTVATIGSGLITAYSQMQNAKAATQAAEQTATAQERAAFETLQQGEDESDRRRAAGAAIKSENRVALAASGVDVGGEHALDLLDDQSTIVEEDAFAIRETARRRATGFSQDAANSLTEANSQRSEATFAPISTILTTAAKVGSKYTPYITKEAYA